MGRLFVKALGKPSEILTKLNEMAGFVPNEEVELYEARAKFMMLYLWDNLVYVTPLRRVLGVGPDVCLAFSGKLLSANLWSGNC